LEGDYWGFTIFSPSYFPIRIPSFANNKLFVAKGFAAKFQSGFWSSAQLPFKKEEQIEQQLYF